MRGETHQEWGAVSGAAISAAAGFDPLAVLICAFVGWRCATWADAIERDSKHKTLRHARKFSPFRKHRGMSHSWEINALVMLLAWALPPIVDYPFWALALAWNSHLTGDFIFGKAGYGRKAGIPFVLGTNHHGLGVFKVGNMTERGVCAVLHAFKYLIIGAAFVYSLIHLAGGM